MVGLHTQHARGIPGSWVGVNLPNQVAQAAVRQDGVDVNLWTQYIGSAMAVARRYSQWASQQAGTQGRSGANRLARQAKAGASC